jgi:hypothetical protein
LVSVQTNWLLSSVNVALPRLAVPKLRLLVATRLGGVRPRPDSGRPVLPTAAELTNRLALAGPEPIG